MKLRQIHESEGVYSDRIRTKGNPLKGLKVFPKSNIGYDMVLELPNGVKERVIAVSDYLIFTECGVYKR